MAGMPSNRHLYGSYVTELWVQQHPKPHMLEKCESMHQSLGLVHELKAQKAGRQELTEAAKIILESFFWPSAYTLLPNILC